MSNTPKVFYISGSSSGFGLILTNKLLEKGCYVAATSRDKQKLTKNVEQSFVTENNFLALEVDVKSDESVKKSIEDTISKFSRIDVVINNCGYSQYGALEELSDEEITECFNVNVFGYIRVIRNSLPHLRANKTFPEGPRIINISSSSGFSSYLPGIGIYGATKHAVEGLSESLSQELLEFGIHVTTILPGPYRTNFSNNIQSPKNPIPEYTSVRKSEAMFSEQSGKQAGDPYTGSDCIIDVAFLEKPPVHFWLGKSAHDAAKRKMERVTEDLKVLYDQSINTQYK
ncbi:hypothetical protein DICPUDRAFT_73705 [Dictyostelium purpureum]|uniref:Short-chain dehydrogenase/reductase SDR n=1 Tax=Dictyostelium purpureum TaxID=5786 RepID=F1A4B4_DICPU|nr:uncharacterized protein DICPUDRAFT_73705 [Dictyostelium purpureum]EGC28967.1 hypothetical protein DICPUDRAFT_73705 [Dictyostelium purpureum]|eukprot:XP_003294506.1 hypothetical protein DICPUDRAFT_73705 [Dictyostelium purpureum]